MIKQTAILFKSFTQLQTQLKYPLITIATQTFAGLKPRHPPHLEEASHDIGKKRISIKEEALEQHNPKGKTQDPHIGREFKEMIKNELPAKTGNSITNEDKNIVFVNGVNPAWNEDDIKRFFDPENENIYKINLVKNRLGKATGKAVITFKNSDIAVRYMDKWHQNWMESEEWNAKLLMYPWELKTQKDKVTEKADRHGLVSLYVYNLPFTCISDDVMKLASEFGDVSYVEMPQVVNGRNKGYAFVYFTDKHAAESFRENASDTDFMGRPLRIKYSQIDPKTANQNKKQNREEKYSDHVLNQTSDPERRVRGENLDENMKLYKKLMEDKSEE
jgi:RNA recognition motif-containing protein